MPHYEICIYDVHKTQATVQGNEATEHLHDCRIASLSVPQREKKQKTRYNIKKTSTASRLRSLEETSRSIGGRTRPCDKTRRGHVIHLIAVVDIQYKVMTSQDIRRISPFDIYTYFFYLFHFPPFPLFLLLGFTRVLFSLEARLTFFFYGPTFLFPHPRFHYFV